MADFSPLLRQYPSDYSTPHDLEGFPLCLKGVQLFRALCHLPGLLPVLLLCHSFSDFGQVPHTQVLISTQLKAGGGGPVQISGAVCLPFSTVPANSCCFVFLRLPDLSLQLRETTGVLGFPLPVLWFGSCPGAKWNNHWAHLICFLSQGSLCCLISKV